MPNIPTVSFDPTTPNGSQAISLGDDRIRELKVQLQEVIAQDHKMAASGQSADTGFHNQVTFIEQASAPTTTGTNYIAIYGKEINSKTEIFLKDEAGTEYQLTKNGKLYVTNSDGLLAVVKGGTGLATFAQGDLLYASASDVLSALAKNTSATRYLSNTGASNAPAWAQVDMTNGVTGILPIANGGTGTTTGINWVPNNMQVFTSSGTWTKPAGVSSVYVKVLGAGGGGGTNNSSAGSGGGGAGGYSEGPVSVSGDVTVTVGTGGSGGTTGTGGTGGNSSFAASGGTLQGNGGAGGAANSGATGGAGGAGGTASGGTLNLTGSKGDNGVNSNSGLFQGAGAGSIFGSGATTPAGSAVGETAVSKGSGGAGGISDGGAGADGIVIVYY